VILDAYGHSEFYTGACRMAVGVARRPLGWQAV